MFSIMEYVTGTVERHWHAHTAPARPPSGRARFAGRSIMLIDEAWHLVRRARDRRVRQRPRAARPPPRAGARRACSSSSPRPGEVGELRDALAPLTPSGERSVIDPAIDEVKNRRDETTKILSATRVVKLSIGLLAALLVLASILLISNTIRLSLMARRREVAVMKLVGATTGSSAGRS